MTVDELISVVLGISSCSFSAQQQQPNSEDYAPFSPESLDATKFSRKDDEPSPPEAANLSSVRP